MSQFRKTPFPGGFAQKEALAGDRLPYREMIDENVALLRDGSVMLSLMVPGVAFETADTAELNAQTAAREMLLRSSLDARFILYHHIIRRRVQVELDGQFDDCLAAHIDERWREKTSSGAFYVNDQFLTIVRRPARGKVGWHERLGKALRKTGGGKEPASQADVRALRAVGRSFVASLDAYNARLLGEYESGNGRCSEVLELLSALYNGELRPVRAPGAGTDIGYMLPYRRISFGLDALELRGAGGSDFASVLSVKDYPDSTSPGIMDGLLRLPCEFVLTETFAPADRQIARERIDLSLRRLRAADEEAIAERREMLAARDALGTNAVGFGDHHLSILVRAGTLADLDDAMATCSSALADGGAIAVREEVNLEPSFWAQFPGNEQFIVRRALISTSNMACFASLHGFSMGQAAGTHWGQAVTLLMTTSQTPFFFNFHQGDLGNFSVIGPSGSGKTVVMNFLAAQAQRFDPRTILFDKDRGSEVFLRGIGGTYSRIAVGSPTGFNPLALPDTMPNRAFLRDLLGVILDASGADELSMIARAVDAAYSNEPSLRRLRYFRELLAGSARPRTGDLASRLDAWIEGGEHAWLFDNAEDRLDLSVTKLGFDMTAVLENPRLRTPVMMYLFHRIEDRLDGDPTMILIDEGWKALDDEVFAARIRDWLKTLRKRNALVGFATQSASDALDSRIATALVEQTATMIFMPNSRARAEHYCAGFGLTEHELEVIRTLPAKSHCFLVRQSNASAVVRLDLSGMPEILTVLSGREKTVRRLDMLRETCGDDPASWYSSLVGAQWPGGEEPNLESLRWCGEAA